MNNAVIHTTTQMAPTILQLDDVRVRFPISNDWLGRPRGYAHALNGIDLQVRAGETLGIVGESGCGKSTLAQLLMGLVPPSSGKLNWASRSGGEGSSNVQIVFQDPQSSLDPRLPVWKIITEPLYARGHASRAQMRDVAARVAAQVGIRPEYLDRFPHQFSGGQRQRIAIARALSSDPDIIVLDEPTSALDISVQAQILNLLVELQSARNLTYILISHNVSVVRHMANRVAVMYLGQIVELGSAAQVLDQPRHPYTRLLLEAVPRLGVPLHAEHVAAPTELPGNRRLPSGCFFRERCGLCTAGCEKPQALLENEQQRVRCHLQS
ncbi:peptide ABC transporter ATP-binding protein [Pseudomonas sp. GW456-L14]|uniref:oligopeptide/dipeptide ABC transporter ATP-binding protein n=1 Tax=unclassified Pseudomonas TaxID=196821 RepID=UPI000C87DD0A|nr:MULTISPECIES: oligopeptide/dipeptide ABC transporter ATP-binding protein [unclassified Pseudomonas]PMY36547.1 peptide ABC transporter ATP-binding protein [Pseudomonas sp. GW456-L14]PMY53214.1 peptide ABC transporter ATP-binding protein [Pseudomonas sp. GW456-L12]